VGGAAIRSGRSDSPPDVCRAGDLIASRAVVAWSRQELL